MIGQQLNFYLTADDQLHLLESISAGAGCVLIKRNSARPYDVSGELLKAEDDWAIAYLCQPSRCEQVLTAIRSDSSDASELLAIEFIQPMEEGSAIRRGRFWYATKCAAAGEFVQKPKDFVDWAQAVMTSAKSQLVRHGRGDWIGPDAKRRLEAGLLRLTTP